MEHIGDIADAESKVVQDTNALIDELAGLVSSRPITAKAAVDILFKLRNSVYEDLNQIQHEYLILSAARWLVQEKIAAPDTKWQWNPRQTGGRKEPDLRGTRLRTVIVSAEVTTSNKPDGTIRIRMENTLGKLNGDDFLGEKFYFVTTAEMQNTANSLVKRDGLKITVVRLDGNT
jgi:hypothetical protein